MLPPASKKKVVVIVVRLPISSRRLFFLHHDWLGGASCYASNKTKSCFLLCVVSANVDVFTFCLDFCPGPLLQVQAAKATSATGERVQY